jgi:hypothetical protein
VDGGVMNFVENLRVFAQSPANALNDIIKKRDLWLALIGYGAGALSAAVMLALEDGGTSQLRLTAMVIFFLSLHASIGFFLASSSHLLLEITTAKGTAYGLFTLIGLSEFTKTLLVAYALIAAAFPFLGLVKAWVILFILGLQLYSILYMMQKVYGLSKIRTFFSMLLSFIPSIISLLALLVIAGVLLFKAAF